MDNKLNKYKGTILITGGNGLIGRHLSDFLDKAGYQVNLLVRSIDSKSSFKQFNWNVNESKIDPAAFENIDYIIHLAGANIGEKRWTWKRKQEIIDSRVKSGNLLFETIKNLGVKPKAIISSSAVGYYGTITIKIIFREKDPAGNDFLGSVCQQWENSIDRFEELGIRVVKLRTAVVLTSQGGALEKMLLPVKMGVGAALGTGYQFMPWIHIDDLCSIYLKAIEDNEMAGAFNAVAPEHVTNKEFTRLLCKTLHRTYWAPNVPAFVLKLIFGEMADILLKGSRVSSEKIINAGFNFKYSGLQQSLDHLLNN